MTQVRKAKPKTIAELLDEMFPLTPEQKERARADILRDHKLSAHGIKLWGTVP